MATNNPLVQTNNVVQATTNPQTNINNLQTQQPIQTLPVTTNQNNQIQSNEQYNVPTPVVYTGQQNQNSNMYQDVFNNYKSQYSYTPEYPQIVIDATNNNTLEGQFQSNYSNALNQIANSILNMRFSYNPNEDDLLRAASQYVTQNTFESMNSKGILNSSMTAERVAQVVGKLIPEYEKMARDEFDASFSRMLNTANLIFKMDDREFTYWQDARDQKWKEEEQAYQRKQDALKNAWTRVDELGYVDNDSSIILGVPVGTLSKDAREAKEAYERKIEEWNRQHEIETQTEKELLKLKQDMEKELYEYKSNIESKTDLLNYENKLKLQQQYNTSTSGSSSSSSKSNLSTYESVIQNAWGEKDVIQDTWSIKNGMNDRAYNYLAQQYAVGNLSAYDFSVLIAKYGIEPVAAITTNSKENTSNISTTSTSNKTEASTLTSNTIKEWLNALDGNKNSLKRLGIENGTQRSWEKTYINNLPDDAQRRGKEKDAVEEALRQIESGKYVFTTNQQLMYDLEAEKFGKLSKG